MWHLGVGTADDVYESVDRKDEETIVARYEIKDNQFILTQEEEESIFKDVADLVLNLYDRNQVKLETLEFRENDYPHVFVNEGRLGMPSNWITQFYQSYMIAILMHEYGHMLTMSEADYEVSESCPSNQFYLNLHEVCFNVDSYINLYSQAFWKDYDEQ